MQTPLYTNSAICSKKLLTWLLWPGDMVPVFHGTVFLFSCSGVVHQLMVSIIITFLINDYEFPWNVVFTIAVHWLGVWFDATLHFLSLILPFLHHLWISIIFTCCWYLWSKLLTRRKESRCHFEYTISYIWF